MKAKTDIIKCALTLLLSLFLWTGQANADNLSDKLTGNWVVSGCNVGYFQNDYIPGGIMIANALKLSAACLGIVVPDLDLSSGTGSWEINQATGKIEGYTIHQMAVDGEPPYIVVLELSGDIQGLRTGTIVATITATAYDAADFIENVQSIDQATPLIVQVFPAEVTKFLSVTGGL